MSKRRFPNSIATGRPDRELLVQEWRAEQLRWLGLPWPLAEVFDLVDWHELATLLDRGWPPGLALQIAP